MDQEALSVSQVATLLGVCTKSVYEAASRGELPHRRLGRRLLFSRKTLLEWLHERKTPARG